MRSATSLRVFVAIEFPSRELARIDGLVGGLRTFGARVAWVPATNVHLTLAFLGDIEMDRVGSASSAVTVASRAVNPFELTLSGTGTFPSSARAKILWVGVRGDLAALAMLQERIAEELRAEGFALDDKPFRPHATIGRVKQGRGPEFAAVLRELQTATVEGTPFMVESNSVIRSELLPSGARYSPLARIGLGLHSRTVD